MNDDDHDTDCDCSSCRYWKCFYMEQRDDEARDLADELKREEWESNQ